MLTPSRLGLAVALGAVLATGAYAEKPARDKPKPKEPATEPATEEPAEETPAEETESKEVATPAPVATPLEESGNTIDLAHAPRITLPAGTPLNLVLLEDLYSQRNEEGDEVVFALSEDVVLLGTTYLVKGTPLLGHVTGQKAAQSWGRSGSLDVEVASIVPPYGLPIVVSDSVGDSGSNRIGKVILNYLLWGGLALPGATKGQKIELQAGMALTLFTGADGVVLDIPAADKTAMVNDWVLAKVRKNFRTFSWAKRKTVTQAFAMRGVTLTDDMIKVIDLGDYKYLVGVETPDGLFQYEFDPFIEVHENKSWKPLVPRNQSSELLLEDVD
ncbi:MAG: hypothetical protein ABI743_10050 [bacterium]